MTTSETGTSETGTSETGSSETGSDTGPDAHHEHAHHLIGDEPLVLLLHGPNLNLLGEREPEVYGTATLTDYAKAAVRSAAEHGLRIESHQSNHEGELIELIHSARGRCVAIIINPGAFTHYAWAIHDALAAFDGPIVEVHISNPNAREPWRHTSVIAPVATGSIMGFGIDGYDYAVRAIAGRVL